MGELSGEAKKWKNAGTIPGIQGKTTVGTYPKKTVTMPVSLVTEKDMAQEGVCKRRLA